MDDDQALRQGIARGTSAALVSTALLLALSRAETGHAFAATNATSHWLWADRALRQNAPSWRYTATGYAIHHLACIWWAVVSHRALRDVRASPWAKAAVTAAVAGAVDYVVCPKRLRPGYEGRLSKLSVALSYVACGVGWALSEQRQQRRAAAHEPASSIHTGA